MTSMSATSPMRAEIARLKQAIAMASGYAEWHRKIMAKEYPEGSPCWHIQRQAPLRSSGGVRYFKLCEDPGCLVKHDEAQPWTIAPGVVENLPPAE